MNRYIFRTIYVALVLLATSLAAAQDDVSQFGLDAVTKHLIDSLHAQSDILDANAILNYNNAVAAWKIDAGIKIANGQTPSPAPEPPLLRYVNDDQVRAMEMDWQHPESYQMFSFKRYVPPPDKDPDKKPKPTVLVGPTSGNGIYDCVVGDDSPDGAKFGDARGVFQKHLYVTPFGKGCGWTLLFSAQ